jgi:hypothetical protein
MVLICRDAGSKAMRPWLLATVGIVVLVASASPAAAAPTDERLIAVTPNETYEFPILAQGKAVVVTIVLHDGASHGGVLSGPGLCKGASLSTNVIAVSTSGQRLVRAECGVLPAGRHLLHFDSGASAFVGAIRVVNATLAG